MINNFIINTIIDTRLIAYLLPECLIKNGVEQPHGCSTPSLLRTSIKLYILHCTYIVVSNPPIFLLTHCAGFTTTFTVPVMITKLEISTFTSTVAFQSFTTGAPLGLNVMVPSDVTLKLLVSPLASE